MTEERIGKLIDSIIAILRKNANDKGAVLVLKNEEYKAEFLLTSKGAWILKSPLRTYTKNSPTIDYLLEKYARLEDPNFNDKVGDHALYDTEEDYVKASQRYVQKNRSKFLRGFEDALQKAYKKLR